MDRMKFLNIIFALTFASSLMLCNAKLSATFYDRTCPNLQSIVRTSIRQAISRERRMAASLIRLHFHDCFVQGCDASLLLNSTSTFQSEQFSRGNNNSVRGFAVIEAAKRAVERACPRVVSCADILTLAARDATVAVGGPTWTVRLGRRDSIMANQTLASINLPSAFANATGLIENFNNQGLSVRDMVALSGSHTLGQSRCAVFRPRIYENGTDIDPNFASTRRRTCPQTAGNGDANLAPLDLVTPNSWDNNYYRNIAQRRGLLVSDQTLSSQASTNSIVNEYINNPRLFDSDFASAMVRMSEIHPLLGQRGIIRRVCGAIN